MRKAIDSIWIITNSEWNSVLAAMTHVDDSYIANWLMISITIDVDAGQPSWFWSMELQNAQKTQKCSTTTLQWWSPSSGLFEGAFFSQPETFFTIVCRIVGDSCVVPLIVCLSRCLLPQRNTVAYNMTFSNVINLAIFCFLFFIIVFRWLLVMLS